MKQQEKAARVAKEPAAAAEKKKTSAITLEMLTRRYLGVADRCLAEGNVNGELRALDALRDMLQIGRDKTGKDKAGKSDALQSGDSEPAEPDVYVSEWMRRPHGSV